MSVAQLNAAHYLVKSGICKTNPATLNKTKNIAPISIPQEPGKPKNPRIPYARN